MGAHSRRLFGTWVLEDPHQEVDRVTQHQVELMIRPGGGPYSLAEEAGSETNTRLVDFVRLFVNARSTASLL